MPRPRTHTLLGTALVSAIVAATLLAGAFVAGPAAAVDHSPRDTAHGLLVFSVAQAGNDDQYVSVDGKRRPFGGTLHADLLDAVEQAAELDLSRFESDGRITLADGSLCLGVERGVGTQPSRAVEQPCREGDANQEWRVPAGSENRLQNVGSGLWPSNMVSVGGWSMTGSMPASPFHLLSQFVEGRPEATPRFSTTYDWATDTVTLNGRAGAPFQPITVAVGPGTGEQIATSTADGTFSAELPAGLGALPHLNVRWGDAGPWAVSIRTTAVANAGVARDADGTVVIRGSAAKYTTVHVGTGPLEADVVAEKTSSSSGGVRIPLPDAEPGETYFVYQREDGVRTRLTIPAQVEGLVAVDGPDTVLDRAASTPVPVTVRTTVPLTRLTPDLTLTAPAGTVFTPGQLAIDGQVKPSGREWQPIDLRLRIGEVTISADGRTLTAHGSLDAISFSEGDEIRWLPTLDVVDPAIAPKSV